MSKTNTRQSRKDSELLTCVTRSRLRKNPPKIIQSPLYFDSDDNLSGQDDTWIPETSTKQARQSRTPVKSVTKSKVRKNPTKKSPIIRPPDDIDLAIADYQNAKSEKERCPDVKRVNLFTKQFKSACDLSKREAEKLDREQAANRTTGKTRSGINRKAIKTTVNSDGRWINRGMDESQDRFDPAEGKYLENIIVKLKAVTDLNFDHLRYLVLEVFLVDLKRIKDGQLESSFHDRYFELGEKATDLFAEIRTSLFTNEQRDYLNGLLLGAFDAVSKDVNGDIKHLEMRYITIVMLAEITIRIVKYVHKFKSNEEAFAFMMKSSREALGLGDDDE